MLRKKEVFTIITPIPGFIPRQLAIDILHSHSEVITLNPLVLSHKPIAAPRSAAADEYYSTWYEIEERIQYIPGTGRAGSGRITFNGCFHDMPWGLQTHILAPLGVDLRSKYRVEGNEPGEPPMVPEMGLKALGAPADGLYLREDVEIRCNIAVISFVKKELKAACGEMVQRFIKKAELLDAGVLQAMFEDGKLITMNPNDRSASAQASSAISSAASPESRFSTLSSVRYPYRPPSLDFHNNPNHTNNFIYRTGTMPNSPSLSPGLQVAPAPTPAPTHALPTFVAELAGDTYPRQPSPGYQQRSAPGSPGLYPAPLQVQQASQGYQQYQQNPNFISTAGPTRWSSQSTPASIRTSISSAASAPIQQSSPGLQSSFAAELPAHQETVEEHHHSAALKKLEQSASAPWQLQSQQQMQAPQSEAKVPLYPPPDYSGSGYGDQPTVW